MLTLNYELASGESGEVNLEPGEKWVFGRPDGNDVPDVSTDDRRVSRGALVIRDSGPGPVLFRGQRGDHARVGLVATDGTTAWLQEGTAENITSAAHRVEMFLGDEAVITVDVAFNDRGSVVERQQQSEQS